MRRWFAGFLVWANATSLGLYPPPPGLDAAIAAAKERSSVA